MTVGVANVMNHHTIILPSKRWVLLLPRVLAIGNSHLISGKAIIDSITFCKFEPFID